MRILLLINIAIIALFALEVSAQSIRLAPLPMLDTVVTNQQFSPFAEYLSIKTGQQVELVNYNSYENLLAEFIQDKIDLAYLGPLPYAVLISRDPTFVPIVSFVDAEGNSTYTCSLVTFDSDINGLSDQILPIALTQPLSTCGYLMTESMLKHQGLSLENSAYYYTGKHSECALDVIRGKACCAGVKTAIADKYRILGLQLSAESTPVPGFLLVANPRTLGVETIATIRESLLQLDPRHNPSDAQVTKLWGENLRYGAVSAYPGDYQSIQDKLPQIKIPGGNQ
jgi:phosphonate transport system substrate-binding protein